MPSTMSRISMPRMTKYEYTAVISERAEQIARGAHPLIEVPADFTGGQLEYGNLAEQELRSGHLQNWRVIRTLPSGIEEHWFISELKLPPME